MAAPRPITDQLPWSAIGVAGILVAVTLAAVSGGLRHTGGVLVYPIDDPYIHMSIARNLALHGSWGVNPGAFEPASSSPLWTLLLAMIDRLAGPHVVTPLVLNLLIAVAIVVVIDRWLATFIVRAPVRAAVVLAIALAIPLPAVITTGMEAPLHVLLTLLLARGVAGAAFGDEPAREAAGHRGDTELLRGLLSGLCVLTRFESVFLVASLAALALGRGRRATAAALATGAALALAGYMAFALPHGGLWLPNPVLVKSPLIELATQGIPPFLVRIPYWLIGRRFSHVTALLLAAVWLLLMRPRVSGARADTTRTLLSAFVAATLLHVQVARLGWFYRYEAYLVALGLTVIAASIACRAPFTPGRPGALRLPVVARVLAALLLLGLATPLATRTVRSLREISPAMRNIYEQQYQMARLVRSHFRDHTIAVNDLGAIGYYGGARVVDLLGLADCDITRARIAGRFDTDAIRRTCDSSGVELAIVYRGWFSGASALPAAWVPLARWTVPEDITVGDTTVTILATGAGGGSVEDARAEVRAFGRELPPRVRVELPE